MPSWLVVELNSGAGCNSLGLHVDGLTEPFTASWRSSRTSPSDLVKVQVLHTSNKFQADFFLKEVENPRVALPQQVIKSKYWCLVNVLIVNPSSKGWKQAPSTTVHNLRCISTVERLKLLRLVGASRNRREF